MMRETTPAPSPFTAISLMIVIKAGRRIAAIRVIAKITGNIIFFALARPVGNKMQFLSK